jgi:hypothetical protein
LNGKRDTLSAQWSQFVTEEDTRIITGHDR